MAALAGGGAGTRPRSRAQIIVAVGRTSHDLEYLAAWNLLLERARSRVAFYAERLPDRPLTSLDQVADLPFTDKDDFRRTYPFGMLAVPLDEVVRVHMSSGTTGSPVVTGYTSGDIDRWAACMARVMEAAGAGPSDVVQNAYGYGLFTGGMGFHLGGERLGCAVVPTSSGVTVRQVKLLRDLGTTIICCTPSYALVLGEAVAASGGPGGLRLRAGFFGAEPWSDGMRGHIEAALGLEAFDIYGLTEAGGPGVAVECHRHDGLHVFEDHYYVEVVDPAGGRPVPAGEEGELVVTGLRRAASPVIRYRTRDRTVLLEEPCLCGSPFRRMARLRGRTDDMLIVRGENVFPSQIEDVICNSDGVSANYQLVVDREAGRLDTLEVRVEAAGSGPSDGGTADRLRTRVRDTMGLDVLVTLLEPGTLARSEGKARRVIDRREL